MELKIQYTRQLLDGEAKRKNKRDLFPQELLPLWVTAPFRILNNVRRFKSSSYFSSSKEL